VTKQKQKDEVTISFKVDGRSYTMRMSDFNGIDARDFRRELDMSLLEGFEHFDLDTAAGLLWLHRRKREPKLTFEQVAGSFNYDSLDLNDKTTGAEPDEDPTDPEPSAGN
jgi:hypothetical protein